MLKITKQLVKQFFLKIKINVVGKKLVTVTCNCSRVSGKNAVCQLVRSIGFDYQSFGNRTFNCVRLAKFYCEFDYVRVSSAI